VDIFAHGLWSYQLVGRRSRIWPAVVSGVAPDLFAFAPYVTERLVRGELAVGKPETVVIPTYVFRLYDISHSLLIAGFVFALLYLILRRVPSFLLAWPLHIAMDIPTHSRLFFPTPFLWPLLDYRVDGIPWSTPWFLLVNYAALVSLFAFHASRKRKGRK
jgi:hypothetical protein